MTLCGFEIAPGTGWFQTRAGNYIRGAIIGHGEAKVYQSIQTDFQTLEQLVTSLTGTGLGLLISNAQLLFGNTIETTEFLLFLQQCSIGGELAAAGLAMRTGRERTFYTRTFRIVPQALTDTTAQFVFGSTCGRHNSIPF